MASLGELTVGSGHEIQNPLNFVNNFADMSAELVSELQEERAKGTAAGDTEDAELLDDLEQILTKISQYEQRASGIVRGMLEHSPEHRRAATHSECALRRIPAPRLPQPAGQGQKL